MLKRFLSVALLALAAACSTAPGTSPAQTAINTTAESCKAVTASIVAADQAVKAGVLKGDNARTALKGLTAAQTGCELALASIQAANAAANPGTKP